MNSTPILLIFVMLMSGLGYAKDTATKKGNTILSVKECPASDDIPKDAICAESFFPVRLVFKVKHGERPKALQVIKCRIEKGGNISCDHDVSLHLDTALLPKQD